MHVTLYIRQRIFSWTDSYDVTDQTGASRYRVKAELFSLGHRIHVFDCNTGDEVGSIRQKLFTLLPTFEIWIGNRCMGTVREKVSFFRERYEVDFRGWEVDGNFLGWDYRVVSNGREVMTISKEIFRLTDTYALSYADPANEIPGLLLVLAIDAANCSHDD